MGLPDLEEVAAEGGLIVKEAKEVQVMRKKYDAAFMKRASYIIYSISAQQQQLTSGNPNQKSVVDQIGQL